MTIYYSASTRGFYDSAIHVTRPTDAVAITEAEHAALLAGQAMGKRIVAGADGRPTLADPPAATDAQIAAAARARRDRLLAASDWTQVADVPLSKAQRAAWASYRNELRNLTGQAGFPRSITWPTPPTA